eukprot:jgi/Psemu1/21703/gm1.21703_g
MNTQFQPCIQYKRTFDVTEDHDNHKLVVDYARITNRSAGKKNIRRVQNLEVEEVLYTYDLFVDTCNNLGMPTNRWLNRPIKHTKEGFKATIWAYIKVITPDPDARGTMITAFEHQHMAKPMEVSKHKHFSRIDTILDYIDMLPGDDDSNLTKQQCKRMFFKTHPRSWQDAYMDTARRKSSIRDSDEEPEEDPEEDPEEEMVVENVEIIHKEITHGSNVTSIQRIKHLIHNTSGPTTTVPIQEATQAPDLVTASSEDEEDLEAEEDPEAEEPEEDPATRAIIRSYPLVVLLPYVGNTTIVVFNLTLLWHVSRNWYA